MQWLVAVLALFGLVIGGAEPTASTEADGPLDADQMAAAVAAARTVLHDDDEIASATYTIRRGRVLGGNTGHPCTSGTMVRIQLIGSFPHISTIGHPVNPGEPMPDFTVGSVQILADVGADTPCLIGVQTLENGPLHPRDGSWTLDEP